MYKNLIYRQACLLQVSDNGWITAAIFHAWLRDTFIPKTQEIKKPLLLLVDGHVSHTSLLETSLICEKNGIILYCLMAHASHVIQPLDQDFFGSVKAEWSEATRQHVSKTGDAVGLDSFAKVFGTVWEKCSTKELAESSFKASGVYPFSPQRVLGTGKVAHRKLLRREGQPQSGGGDPGSTLQNAGDPAPTLTLENAGDPSPTRTHLHAEVPASFSATCPFCSFFYRLSNSFHFTLCFFCTFGFCF